MRQFVKFIVAIVCIGCVQKIAYAVRMELSLNGLWETAIAETLDRPPQKATWTSFHVPGTAFSIRGEKRWFRRKFQIPAEWQGKRIYIRYDGVKFNSVHFVNGQLVGKHFRGYDPFEIDITKAVQFGAENELLVGCCDWQGTFIHPIEMPLHGDIQIHIRPIPKDLVLTPIGGRFEQYGIWADVSLVAVSPVHIYDVTVRTSVRKWLLEVIVELRNTGDTPALVSLRGRVLEEPKVKLTERTIRLAPGESRSETYQVRWRNPKLWTPDEPNLYYLDVELLSGKTAVDSQRIRFGFREFWCEGIYFYLNGTRLLLRANAVWPSYGDGHSGSQGKDKEEAKRYLEAVKSINVNQFRTHTQPWRRFFYDAADEVGILIVPEAPVWNFDDEIYRLDDDRFWENYWEELRGMYRRLKNHPSVVIWSLENEFYGPRLNDETPERKRRLVELGRRLKELDPTRLIMYHSDGDPGGIADIVNLHYPHELGEFFLYPNTCYWLDEPKKPTHWFNEGKPLWEWDRKKPLHIGEYLWCPFMDGTPAPYSIILGDEAYSLSPWDAAKLAKAVVWSMQTRAYRYYRVSGAPWAAYPLPGQELGPEELAQKESMRPLAAFVKEYNTRFYAGQKVRRTLHIMNDTLYSGTVRLNWKFVVGGKVVSSGRKTYKMSPAELRVDSIEFETPNVQERTQAELLIQAEMERAPTFEEKITCWVFPKIALYRPKRKIGVISSDGSALELLRANEIPAVRLEPTAVIPQDVEIVIVDKDALPDKNKNVLRINRLGKGDELDQFLRRGGRLLVLRQKNNEIGGDIIPFLDRQATITFPLWRKHPLLKNIQPGDVKFWSPDHIVAEAQVYRTESGLVPVLVSGSKKGINYSPLAEGRRGKGLLIVCGLRLLDTIDIEPAANFILNNILQYMDEYQPDAREPVVISEDSQFLKMLKALGIKLRFVRDVKDVSVENARFVLLSKEADLERVSRLVEGYVRDGGLLWWHRPNKQTFDSLMKKLGLLLQLTPASGPVWLNRDDPFNGGLAQQDLYWTAKPHPGWWYGELRPLDHLIIDSEVSWTQEIDLTKAKSYSTTKMQVSGWGNKPVDDSVLLCSRGSIVGEIDFGDGGWLLLGCRARGTPCQGVWPRVSVKVASKPVGQMTVFDRDWRTYVCKGNFAAGVHEVEFEFINDAYQPPEDRNVWISHIYLQHLDAPTNVEKHTSPAALASILIGKGRLLVDTVKWEEADEENVERANSYVRMLLFKLGAEPTRFIDFVGADELEYEKVPLNGPRDGLGCLYNTGSVYTNIVCDEAVESEILIRAKGTKAAGEWPILVLKLDGKEIGSIVIDSGTLSDFHLPVRIPKGTHRLEIRFINDYYKPGEADRNCFIKLIAIQHIPL